MLTYDVEGNQTEINGYYIEGSNILNFVKAQAQEDEKNRL